MILLRVVCSCLVLIICLGLSTGCWDRKEIDDLALVMASGFDLTDDDQLEVTLQIALPTGIPSALQGGGKSQKTVLVVSAIGKDVYDCLNQMQQQLSRDIFLGHRGVIVFGEKYARHGINQALDGFVRSPASRYNSYVVTAYGTTAKEILNTPYLLEQIPAIGIKLIQLSGVSLSVKIDQFLDALAASGKSPVTGAVRIVSKGTSQQTFTIDKAAVYQGNKLVGFLSQKELNILRWWIGDSERTKMSTKMEPGDKEFKGTISIEVLRVQKKLLTSIKNGVPEVSVEFKATARTLENDTRLDISKADNLKRIETKFSNDTEKVLTRTFSLVQKEWEADIWGFGDEIHIKHPYVWKKIKNQWSDIYPKVPVTVKVDIAIERTGRTQKPAHLGK